MTRSTRLLAVLAVLLTACGHAVPTTPAQTGTLGNWYADAAAAPDASADAIADADADDAAPDAVADAADATPDALPDLPDAATADALADAPTADVVADDAADAADAPDLQEVADVPDAPDVADVADAPDAGDSSAGICFHGGPPAADAFVADIAPMDPGTCPTLTPPASWFATVPAPSLVVTPGFLGADGLFAPYVNDQWAPIVYGMQGSFHVWAGFTVAQIPNATASTLQLDVQIWGDTGCVTVNSGIANVVTAVPTTDGQYSTIFVGSSGIPTQFYVPAASSYLYCGIWLNLHMRVHDPVSGAWGEAVRTLRLYDSKP